MPRWYAVLLAILIALVAALGATVWVLLEERRERAVAEPSREEEVPAEEPPPELVLEPAAFADLPGWLEDDPGEALPALLQSCRVFARRPADRPVGPEGLGGTIGDWREPCREAARLEGVGAAAVRAFFQERFRPWAVSDRGDPEGLFTGYYEPSLRGSRRRHGPYRTPLYRTPRDLVSVDLGEFREDLAGRRIAGRIRGGRLRPYPERSEIVSGALAGRDLEIVWVDDPVDAFFLHIQGSGRVVMEDGTVLRLGYAAQNGHPYTAIGRELVARGELALEEVSMQSIRRWLAEHPDEAPEVMAANASFVFFRTLEGPGPLGSLGVPLTAGRSLAVDRTYLPLGAPLWLAGWMPGPPAPLGVETPSGTEGPTVEPMPEPTDRRPLRRLVVAQDTGGAIRGPVRGDLFWGPGDEAAALAGRMKHEGRLWLLLPRAVVPVSNPRRLEP